MTAVDSRRTDACARGLGVRRTLSAVAAMGLLSAGIASAAAPRLHPAPMAVDATIPGAAAGVGVPRPDMAPAAARPHRTAALAETPGQPPNAFATTASAGDPESGEDADTASPPDPALRAAIADALVRRDGIGFATSRWSHEPAVVALYFGADWCLPCHAFVPTLREVRDALQAAGADTEVVYVGLDETPSDMARYMRRQKMPWPAVDHRRLRTLPEIRALAGAAPPNLVLVDGDGRILADAWDGRRRVGLAPVLRAWLQAFAAERIPVAPGAPSERTD